ncbi:hypothetical protein OG21DRAFT_723005 [Imleria badia]|nr:hypothetical protein OG21DRAFT_723005 [Imleria badia]
MRVCVTRKGYMHPALVSSGSSCPLRRRVDESVRPPHPCLENGKNPRQCSTQHWMMSMHISTKSSRWVTEPTQFCQFKVHFFRDLSSIKQPKTRQRRVMNLTLRKVTPMCQIGCRKLAVITPFSHRCLLFTTLPGMTKHITGWFFLQGPSCSCGSDVIVPALFRWQ